MSDVGRKVVALSIVILGAGLLWAGRRSYSDADDAKTEMNATIAAAREHSSSSDPRLKAPTVSNVAAGSTSTSKAIPPLLVFSTAICSRRKLKMHSPLFPLS